MSGGSHSQHRSTSGRRGRLNVVGVFAIVLPVLVALSLATVQAKTSTSTIGSPDGKTLVRMDVICPSAVLRSAADVQATRTPGVAGGAVAARVTDKAGILGEPESLEVGDGLSPVPDSSGAVVLTASGEAAPGLVAGRPDGAAMGECREAVYDEWYVGLGAAAKQSSQIELVNPDSATAVVDVEIHDKSGPVDDAAWRGVTVAGGSTKVLNLADHPVATAVAAHVTVTRGRLLSTARHTFDALGQATPTTDYLPGQTEATSDNLILGFPEAGSQRLLFVANPTDDEVRARVRVVTAASTFAPSNSSDVRVPPQSVVEVPMAATLDAKASEGALGLSVEATGPVVTGYRALDGEDLVTAAPAQAYDDDLVTPLPRGAKELVLGGAERTGVVKVTAIDADGEPLLDQEPVEVGGDRAAKVAIPKAAVRLVVTSRNTAIAGTVIASSPQGTGTLRLRPARVIQEVPSVRQSSG